MGKLKKLQDRLRSILVIICSIIMIQYPNEGCIFAVLFFSLYLFLYGLRKIIYFFSMAIHMVGGLTILYEGIICVNLGIITLSLSQVYSQLIMVYLLFYYMVNGIIDLYRSIEAQKMNASLWKIKRSSGILQLLICLLCIININSVNMMIYILSIGLIYSAIVRIIITFRKSAIIYIQ